MVIVFAIGTPGQGMFVKSKLKSKGEEGAKPAGKSNTNAFSVVLYVKGCVMPLYVKFKTDEFKVIVWVKSGFNPSKTL